jgi:ubiquinone/menaquinone biosynthesis C-methylase UbiE
LAKRRRAILDLGCGTGVPAAALTRKPDCLVVGVDPAAAMLALAKTPVRGRERILGAR